MEPFGKRLKRLRVQTGLTLKEVADRLSVASSTYKKWENGRAIQGEPYAKLAEIFEVGLIELLMGSSSRTQAQGLADRLRHTRQLIHEIEIALRSLS